MTGGEAFFGPQWSASLRRGTDAELRGWLELALELCGEAEAIASSHFRRDLDIATKPDGSFVTVADTAIERLIRERVAARFPDHGFIGEEYGPEAAGASVRWYIDPIDGTHNFIRGIPLFGTLIAVERDGELQVGALAAPALRERWWAWRGGGAWATGSAGPRRIAVSRIGDLADSQILYGSGRDIDASGRAPGFRALLDDVWRERGFGDFWGYALVAEGAAEAMVEVDLSPWDAAAPMVLVEEAGGRVTDLEGRRMVDTGTFLTTNGRLHDLVLRRLVGTRPASH